MAGEIAGSDAGEHLYLTLSDDDESEVTGLVRVSGPDYSIRQNGQWVATDPDTDDSPVWGQIVDVTPNAVDVFDKAQAEGPIDRDAFTPDEIPDEEAA